jgi:DNA-binding beta-propeller fold protein YncE
MRRFLVPGGLILATLMVLISACAAQVGLERPNGVAVAADHSLYVMDFGHYRIVHADENGKLLKTAGKFGSTAGEIYFGWDLATDTRGSLYFGSTVREDEWTSHDGVKVYTPDGQFVREIGQADYTRGASEQGHLPYGVDVDSQGRVYTADYGTNTVRIFGPTGQLLATLSGTDQPGFSFTNPGDVAVDDQRSLMYVTDFTMGGLLQFRLSFSPGGRPEITFVKRFGGYGREPGQFAFPQSLAVDDRSGTVYVGDMANRRVQSFDPDGKYLASFAPSGVADWQVMGLTVDADGKVYAGDALNDVIWVFSGAGEPARRVEIKP